MFGNERDSNRVRPDGPGATWAGRGGAGQGQGRPEGAPPTPNWACAAALSQGCYPPLGGGGSGGPGSRSRFAGPSRPGHFEIPITSPSSHSLLVFAGGAPSSPTGPGDSDARGLGVGWPKNSKFQVQRIARMCGGSRGGGRQRPGPGGCFPKLHGAGCSGAPL